MAYKKFLEGNYDLFSYTNKANKKYIKQFILNNNKIFLDSIFFDLFQYLNLRKNNFFFFFLFNK